jgi:propionyl-CoA carboxylase alpha chain
MNTRLQVEHPVTECTTGLDLVALQLEIADGARLAPNPPATQGHSIEVRLYAEDPAHGWQPQSGTLHRLAIPGVATQFTVGRTASGLRLDSGVRDGSVVSVHYDPMLAKVISWAPTRQQAARMLSEALARAQLHGITTNRDLLVNVLRHKAFLDGETDTAFLETHDVFAPLVADDAVAALAAALAIDATRRKPRGVPSGWRNVPSQPQLITLGDRAVEFRFTRDGLQSIEGVELVTAAPHAVVLDVDGVRRRFDVARYGDTIHVDSPDGGARFDIAPRFVDPAELVTAGSLIAPMPGSIVRIAVAVGDRVAAGAPVLWLEAMKMQHQISAPVAGVLSELPVSVGQQIEVGAVLAVLTEDEPEEQPK